MSSWPVARWLFALVLMGAALLLGGTAGGQVPQVVQAKPMGDIQAAKVFWQERFCQRCHGDQGQGGYGPPLAGQGLTFARFERQVREPWGLMPAYVATQVSSEDIRNLVEWFNTMPAPATVAPWRTPIKPDDPLDKRLFIGKGCAQCHGELADRQRQGLANQVWDLPAFITNARAHTRNFPDGQMGNFTERQVSDDDLGRIFGYLTRLGVRVALKAPMTASASGDSVTYTLTLENPSVYDAEQVYIAAIVPAGATVTSVGSADGAWHRGIEGGSDGIPLSAVWLADRVPAKGKLGPLTFEVQGAGAASGSRIWARWLGPTPGGDIVTTPLVRPAR